MSASHAPWSWWERRSYPPDHWSADDLMPAKADHRVSVVIPARNEEATVADVVGLIRRELMDAVPLVDELVVMDSLSRDSTARQARQAGATVWSVADVVPELGVRAGKGEALWKSLFVTTGDLLVFIDADLTEWDVGFVVGLLGPLLTDPGVHLVRGYYDRLLDTGTGISFEGGRVTELVARPLLALHWPDLSRVVQPLAGEWSIRRSHAERLPFPVGYGVEFSTLVDTVATAGLDAVAQVDLGERGHRHQALHDLGLMATEILAVAARRQGLPLGDADAALGRLTTDRQWQDRSIPIAERPPAQEVPAYVKGSR